MKERGRGSRSQDLDSCGCLLSMALSPRVQAVGESKATKCKSDGRLKTATTGLDIDFTLGERTGSEGSCPDTL